MINGWSNGVTFNEAEEWDNNEYQYTAYQREITRLCILYHEIPRHNRPFDHSAWLGERLAVFLRRNGTRKTANYREIAATFIDNTITAEFWRSIYSE